MTIVNVTSASRGTIFIKKWSKSEVYKSILLWLVIVCTWLYNCHLWNSVMDNLSFCKINQKSLKVTTAHTVAERAKILKNFIFHNCRCIKRTSLYLFRKFQVFYVNAQCSKVKSLFYNKISVSNFQKIHQVNYDSWKVFTQLILLLLEKM